jgi:hypothetical protein
MRPMLLAKVAALLSAASAHAQVQADPAVGAVYEIERRYETTERSGEGPPSSTSSGRNIFCQKILGVRATGMEAEYDLPDDTPGSQLRNWQFPARVLRLPNGSLKLLNAADLESRRDSWLAAAGLTSEACGRWYFTWNAFQIECDPQSILKTVEELDPSAGDLRPGAPYRHPHSLAPGVLELRGTTLTATMPLDPDAVRRERAEFDVIASEILGEPTTLEAALAERAKEAISGTITVTFEVAENLRRRTTTTTLKTATPDERVRTATRTEVVERRIASTGGVERPPVDG